MIADEIRLSDLVNVDAGFKPSVQLPIDFNKTETNTRLLHTFIPTSGSIEILTEIAQSLNPNSSERARALVGTFGTGKSDLLLVICNYFSRTVDDPVMQRFYDRLRQIDPARAGIIRQRRENRPPFLVVLLQGDPVSPFAGFVLHGLQLALEKVGQAALMNNTKYQAARQQIEEWRNEGHARYDDFRRTLMDREERDVDGLLVALAGPQADNAMPIFLRTFKQVTGADFTVYGFSQPHEAYANVAEALVGTGKFSGILLVVDEFTAYFERFQRAIDQQLSEVDSETKAVENIAERSSSSGAAQLHFIVASLESFAAAAGGVGSAAVSKAVERVGGRFKHHSLMVQGSEELIRGAITRLPRAEQTQILHNAQRDDLLATAETLWNRQRVPRDWLRDVIVGGAFPLHPVTTYALPLINQRVAQSQRTMFIFLQDQQGLRGFIEREYLHDVFPNWQCLLTVDLLFDYFYASIATKRSDITEAFENASQRLHTATVDTTLAARVLKTVALCEVVSDLSLSATRPFLRRALNLPSHAEHDLDEALHMLEQLEALYPPSEVGTGTGIYSLPMHGRVNAANLRQRINQRTQNLAAATSNHVQAAYPPESINAADYNYKHSAHRKVSAYYVDVIGLRSDQRLTTDLTDPRNRDALLWYVIASTEGEVSEAQNLARELTKQKPQLIVAVPIAPLQILSALKSYQALENLRKDPELDQAARPFLEDRGQVGKDYKGRLDDELRKLRDSRQWEWFIKGDGKSSPTATQIIAMTSTLMEELFPRTPSTNLAMHFPPDGIPAKVANAIEQVLKVDVRIPRSAKGPTENILRTGLVTLGLLQPQKPDGAYDIYSVITPEGRGNLGSSYIWTTMHNHLAAGKPISTLIAGLRRSPYGLYDSLLISFLAAFVVHYADAIEVLPATGIQRSLDIDVPLLRKIIDKPKDYNVQFHPLTDQERHWLRGIVERGLNKTPFVPPQGTPLRNAVATQLKTFITRLQLPSFATTLSEEQFRSLFPQAEPTVITALHTLLRSMGDENELMAILLRELPHRLGAFEDHTKWTDVTVGDVLTLLSAVFHMLRELPALLKERAITRMAAIFDAAEVEPEMRWGVIYHWRLNRAAVQLSSLQGHARTLYQLTNNVRGTIEEVFLTEFARQIIPIGVEYQRWPSLDRLARLEQEIVRAKGEIELQWQQVASGDEVWIHGIARAATGRDISGVKANLAARHLREWSLRIVWPSITRSITLQHVQNLYPELTSEQTTNVRKLLARVDYSEQRWLSELNDVLPREFGLQSWQKQDVQITLKSFAEAMRQAAGLESRLRRHVLDRVRAAFGASVALDESVPLAEVLAAWLAQYAVPEPNDLSVEAKAVLDHVRAGMSDPETLVLMTLPSTFGGDVGQSYQKWENYDVLERFDGQLHHVLHEIQTYQPTTVQEYEWLTGVVNIGLGQEILRPPREKQRLIILVVEHLRRWLQNQQLPSFAPRLTAEEICAVFPKASPDVVQAAMLLIKHGMIQSEDSAPLLLHDLPLALELSIARSTRSDSAFGHAQESSLQSDPAITVALGRLHEACRLMEQLPQRLRTSLLDEITDIFASIQSAVSEADLVSRVRTWRAAYVILPNDELTTSARELYDTLSRADDDLETLFLERLPARISKESASYRHWQMWQTKANYLLELRNAIHEIAARGKVGPGGGRAKEVWEEFQTKLGILNEHERRWIVKAFRDEFQQ